MKAHEILKAAERNDSIYALAENSHYDVRSVQLHVKSYFSAVTYKRISIYYRIAQTLELIRREGYTVEKAYLAVTGSDNTFYYYNLIKEIQARTPWEQKRFLEAMAVIETLAKANKPITLKELGCNRSLIIYIRNTLGYSVLSKPRAGYYFSSNYNDKKNCLGWINNWRKSFGIAENYAFK
ncbi:MAG: hypothetical protein E7509_06200 [Ruminococcus sp.]|nr:hypothetical protein [Ruminococcus sp.]